jgi:hypothetical protein
MVAPPACCRELRGKRRARPNARWDIVRCRAAWAVREGAYIAGFAPLIT